MSYVRGESRFSDHRPVFSIFTAEVETINYSRSKDAGYCSSRVEVEELLPYSHGYAGLNYNLGEFLYSKYCISNVALGWAASLTILFFFML